MRPQAEPDEYEERLPAVSDPSWEEASAALLEYLETPRTVPQLYAWAVAHETGKDVLRNCLAWLNIHGHAETFRDGKTPMWRQRTAEAQEDPIEEAQEEPSADHVVESEEESADEEPAEDLLEIDY